MPAQIGYARVSKEEQLLDLQLTALREAGCKRIFRDKSSGAHAHRRGLADAISLCKRGDVLIVWKLDRLGRSLIDLARLVEELNAKGVGLKVLTGHGAMINTTLPEGRMIFGILAVLAEFERELIRERTKAGMQAARRRGAAIGRPRKVTHTQIRRAKRMIDLKGETRERIAAALGVHVGTLRRALSDTN